MYKLKSIARRGTSLTTALALALSSVGSAVLPAISAYADALNPLTERSLTLSSSSPGWSSTDGSGNSIYAPPNSGANGFKAANYYDFKVSSDSTSTPVKAFTFQYCTTAAGECLAPGNNGWTGSGPAVRNANDIAGQKTDLNVTLSSPQEVGSGDFGTVVGTAADTGALAAVPGYSSGQVGRESEITGAASAVTGNYLVYYRTSDNSTPTDPSDDVWAPSSGWTMTAANHETGTVAAGTATGKNNEIRLTNSAGEGFAPGTRVKILFFANNTNYITNPGAREFFVRINSYKAYSGSGPYTVSDSDIVDGGVTVANIMNLSIWIQTKVLETMDFSVGTVNPDTLDATQLAASEKASGTHGVCDRILTRMTSTDAANVLKMGDPVGEYSLRTDTTFSTHSYWRLSSNSSAGATVYYAGNTLTNTSGDTINAIGASATAPSVGSEQFGLALATSGASNYLTNYTMERTSGKVYEQGADVAANGLLGGSPGVDATWTALVNASKHDNRLSPLAPTAEYGDGAGIVNADYGTIDTNFAFDDNSNQVPVAIASENDQVVDCVTGKMRYIANIAATTPAGIYTTKVNYIASPQY